MFIEVVVWKWELENPKHPKNKEKTTITINGDI